MHDPTEEAPEKADRQAPAPVTGENGSNSPAGPNSYLEAVTKSARRPVADETAAKSEFFWQMVEEGRGPGQG